MRRPRHLLRAWPEMRRRLRRAKRRALFTDYDGTLTPIRRRPEQARMSSKMRQALSEAAQASDVAGVVSGRRLDDVESLVGLPGLWYAGVHGHFLRSPRGKKYSLQQRGVSRKMSRLLRNLRRELRGINGVQVEPKGATVAVHYRGLGHNAAARVRGIVMKQANDQFALLHGKKVWEFVPAGRDPMVNKWTGIEQILRRTRFGPSDHAAVVYLGDDATDEYVFRSLRGVTVAVGKRQRTAARYFVRSTAEVCKFFQSWKEVSS